MFEVYKPPTIEDYLRAPPHSLRKAGGRRSAVMPKPVPGKPLVTAFTVVRNRKETLPQTIESVLSQSYPNIEYIIIDGASTDGTLEVIKQYDDRIDYWISEPDLGIADATNKAISYARGEIIFWLCSDDWADANHIEFAVETLLGSKADFVFGDISYYKRNILEFRQIGDPDYAKSIAYQVPRLNVPSAVIRRACFERIGLFDLRYPVACDYEWLLRLHLRGGRGVYDKRLNICHRSGGISDKQFVQGLKEIRAISIQHGSSAVRASQTFWRSYIRWRLRNLAEWCLPRGAYRTLLRHVRRNYSSHG